jgi:TatD DNase family protein
LGRPSFTRFGSWWSFRTRNAARGVVAVVTIADDLEAALWVVRAADLDPRVYAPCQNSDQNHISVQALRRLPLVRVSAFSLFKAVGSPGRAYV